MEMVQLEFTGLIWFDAEVCAADLYKILESKPIVQVVLVWN